MTIHIKEEYLEFLNNLESWGVQNLSAETVLPYLKQRYPELTLTECTAVATYWMKTKNQLLNEHASVN